jgi:Asp-tRNA(Asn)/Glu-tRNA(Gln) amidotransferase A subunit family amidase
MERRQWMQLMTVLAAGRPAGAQQDGKSEKPGPLTKDHLVAALKVMDLTFRDEQLDLMLPDVNRQFERFAKLRDVEIGNGVGTAFTFRAELPGRRPKAGPSRFVPTVRRVAKPAKAEDIAFLPVRDLAALVRSRRITSVQLTRLYLERLKQYGPKLLCVVNLTEDLAMEQAAKADKEVSRGKYRGPLHGIPYGLKDLFAVKGTRTTWGAEPFQNQMIDVDSTVYLRLREAGAVLVAKLSMGALAMGGLWFGGMTKTPWDTERTSSGSSAGSASATSAGLVGFAIGTETQGSIVSPSFRCGVVGLRPTFGRVSRHGAMALCWTMDKVGPICRSVEDCALVLKAMAGPDGHDLTVFDAPLHFEPSKPLSQLRIGIDQKAFDKMEGESKTVYTQAIEDLNRAGLKMSPVELPDEAADTIVSFVLAPEAAAAFDAITRDGRVDQLSGQKRGDWPNAFRTARLIPAVEYIQAQRARTKLMLDLDGFFQKWDVAVCPPHAHLAATNLTGHPEIALPCGFVKGMPQSLGFLGPWWREDTILRAAHAYEQATEWHRKRPPFPA